VVGSAGRRRSGTGARASARRNFQTLKNRRMAAADMLVRGMRQVDVLAELGVAAQTASRWHRIFLAEGKKGLAGAGRAGRLPKLSDEQLAQVESWCPTSIRDPVAVGPRRWTSGRWSPRLCTCSQPAVPADTCQRSSESASRPRTGDSPSGPEPASSPRSIARCSTDSAPQANWTGPRRSRRGPRRRKLDKSRADKGYDSDPHRLRTRKITPRIARSDVDDPARLGRHRWKIERTTIAWLTGYRRLTIRYGNHFLAFFQLAAAMTCYTILPT
jgi:transposase